MNTYFVLSFLTLSSFDSWLVAVARRAVAIAVNVFAAVVGAEAQHPTGLDFDLFARSSRFDHPSASVSVSPSFVPARRRLSFCEVGTWKCFWSGTSNLITFVLKSRKI